MTERTYTPAIGDRVRLKTFDSYRPYGLEPWTVLHATGIAGWAVTCIRSLTVNGEHDGELVTVKLHDIDTPIGWKPRYTITVMADKLPEVLAWFRDKRGITVHQSHYMPSCPTAFTPSDNSDTADWRFNGADRETIPAELCDELFRVVRLDTVYDAGIPADCQYCNGTGTHTANDSLLEQTRGTATCPHCGTHTGFSFTETWHSPGYRYGYVQGIEQDNSQCGDVRPAGQCWCCAGTGKGMQHLAGMAPKLRKQAIKQLEQAGWKVWYQRSGQLWRMERETVVKEFGQSVSEVQA